MKNLILLIILILLPILSYCEKNDTLKLTSSKFSKNLVVCNKDMCIEYDTIRNHIKLYTYFKKTKNVDFYFIINNKIYHKSNTIGKHVFGYYIDEEFCNGIIIINKKAYYLIK